MYRAALILGIEKILLFSQIVDAAELLDAAQAGQQHDHIVAEAAPDGHNDHGDHRRVVAAQPVNGV